VTGDRWVSMVALAGWLVLALGAWRARQVGARKTVVLALTWVAVFLLATALFTAIGG
jgi:hypothetical protein